MEPIIRSILDEVDKILQFSDKDAILLIYKISGKTIGGQEVETKKKIINVNEENRRKEKNK